MSFCSSCGQPVEPGDRFCTSCGVARVPHQMVPGAVETDVAPEGHQQPSAQEQVRWTKTVLGMTSDYFVTPDGAGQEASQATSNLNTGVTVAGAVPGSLTATGAGLINKGRENDFIRWDEARSVTLNPKKKTVTVTRKTLILPIRLYCTDEIYDRVAGFIRTRVDPAIIRE
jgi:hypothetical protein